MRSLRKLSWHVLILVVASAIFAGSSFGQTLIVTPGTITAAPGQTVSLTARTPGLPGRPKLRWILRGPRVPGADWGKLRSAGNTATYTGPSRPPPGAIVIQVQALGQFGQPVASAQIPVHIAVSAPRSGVTPPPSQYRPPVARPSRPRPSVPPSIPPVTRPPPPPRIVAPPVLRPPPPPRIVAPPPPPRIAAPPAVPPPPRPAAAQPSQVTGAILQAQRRCRARQSGAPYLAKAERLWSGMNAGQRLQVVRALARTQLGSSIPIRVLPPDRRIRNVARVTGQGRAVSITFGTAGANSNQSILDEPLTKPASLGWSYRSLLDFLCYENEVARIRHRLGPICLGMYDSVKAQLDRSQAYVANAKDPAQARAQIASYQRFMASVRARYGARQGSRMAASWLFERIAVERGRGRKSCDMPLSAGGQAYSLAIAPNLKFEHDLLATGRGRVFCPCPR